MPDVDGGLIGGASLKADEFLAILSAAACALKRGSSMLHVILTVVQVFSCARILALVLLQRGKGAEAGAGFGAGASGTVFGARGASTALSRATAIFAAIFMINSLVLTYMGTRKPQRAAEVRFSMRPAQTPAPRSLPTARARVQLAPRELHRSARHAGSAQKLDLRSSRRGGIGRHTSLRG